MFLEFSISGSEFTRGMVTGVYVRTEHVYNDNIKESDMHSSVVERNVLFGVEKIRLVKVTRYVVTAQNNRNELLVGTIAISTKRDFKKMCVLFGN